MPATSVLRALLLPLMTILGLPTFAQNPVADALYTRRAQPDSASPVSTRRVNFGLELGTSFTSFRGVGLQTFASPYLSYRVSRWTFNAGVTLVNNRFPGFSGDARQAVPSSQQVYFFAQGQYQASERLRITGTSFYETGGWSQSAAAGKRSDFNRKAMSVLAEYKVSEHFSFGVGAQYSDGHSPYNSFGGSRFGSNGLGYRPRYLGW